MVPSNFVNQNFFLEHSQFSLTLNFLVLAYRETVENRYAFQNNAVRPILGVVKNKGLYLFTFRGIIPIVYGTVVE